MKSFPMFIRTTGRRVVICGGGEQAAQKARLMLKTDATLVLAAPELDAELAALVAEGRAVHHAGAITPALFEGAAMGFVATGCPGLDAALHGLAKAGGCPVNVVDRPDLCDLTTPSLVDRDPVVVAIGTEGTAPVLARQIKTQVEQMLAPNLGGLAALAGRMRGAVAQRVAPARRRAFWAWAFSDTPRAAWTRGAERAAAQALKAAIAEGRAPGDAPEGSIALVGAGPGSRDLLTLRAVQRLQEADVIFYNGLMLEGQIETMLVGMKKNNKYVYAVTEKIPTDRLLKPKEFEGHHDPHVQLRAQSKHIRHQIRVVPREEEPSSRSSTAASPEPLAVFRRRTSKAALYLQFRVPQNDGWRPRPTSSGASPQFPAKNRRPKGASFPSTTLTQGGRVDKCFTVASNFLPS